MTHLEAGQWGIKIKQEMTARQRDIALIGVTASTHGEAKDQLLKAGMDAVVVKPLDPQQFSQTMHKALKYGQKAELGLRA
jgi:CheY-like chemotaxis protein